MSSHDDETLSDGFPKRGPTIGGRGQEVSRRALRNAFAGQVPEVVARLESDWRSARHHCAAHDVEDLARNVEAFANPARTFGQAELAGAAEDLLAALHRLEREGPGAGGVGRVDTALGELVHLADGLFEMKTDISTRVPTDIAVPMIARSVAVLVSDRAIADALVDALSAAGLRAQSFTDPTTLDLSLEAPEALVVEVDLLGGAGGALALVREMSNRLGRTVEACFVSGPLDDATMPTLPVHHAIFSAPLDVDAVVAHLIAVG